MHLKPEVGRCEVQGRACGFPRHPMTGLRSTGALRAARLADRATRSLQASTSYQFQLQPSTPHRAASFLQPSPPDHRATAASTNVLGRRHSSRREGQRQQAVPYNAQTTPQNNSSEPPREAQGGLETAKAALYTFFKFSRPHTMLGTFVSIMSVSLLAMGPADVGWRSLRGLLQALIPSLLMNLHIVGLNQIFDVEIDKVNKPYLPLASGEYSMQTALWIVGVTGASALTIGVLVGSAPLMATLAGSALLSLVYSVDLPFLRWKQYPVAAAACILAVRAVLVQLGFYFHMKQAIGQTRLVLTRPLLFTMAFMLFFSVVIALFKDIPDVKGDSQAGVRTLSVRLGTSRIFWTCICLLELAYAGAIATGLLSTVLWSRTFTVVAHAALGLILYRRAKTVDVQDRNSIYSCYMFVWKLFYAEYLLIPFLR